MSDKDVVIAETIDEVDRGRLREEVGRLMHANASLQEGLDQVTAMFAREDRGWSTRFTAETDQGLTLDELKDWSVQIKNAQVGNPHIRRGLSLRKSYVWQDGIQYGPVPSEGRGRGSNVQAFIDNPKNQRNFFNGPARLRREANLYADSIALYIGHNDTKQLRYVPLREITADYRDPDWDADIWAYRRTWTSFAPGDSVGKEMNEWYFTDEFYDERVDVIVHEGKNETVSKHHTAFAMIANGVDGFGYGSPDALAALIWSRIFRDSTMDGVTMTSAMATFAFKASVSNKSGADGASMKLAQPGGAGNTAILGQSNDLTPMANAGKGYDFDGLRALAAIVATSLDVSTIAITSDAASAGGLGSASTLDLPTRLAMEARRDEHCEFDKRVLRWMGVKNPVAYFIALTDPVDLYRAQQGVALEWGTGLFTPEETRREFEMLKGNDAATVTVPEGVILPNSLKSLKDQAAIKDASAAKTAKAATDAALANPANGGGFTPTQGSGAAGVGGGQNANDLAQSTLSK